MQATTAEPRFMRRLPCSLSVEGRRHSAMILNLSRGGLFVRTTALAHRGDDVRVAVTLERTPEPVSLHANVVWRRVSHAAMTQVAQGGLGLRLNQTPGPYRHLLGALEDGPAPEAAVVAAEPSLEFVAPKTEVILEPTFHYDVHVRMAGSPRSRWLYVTAKNDETASHAALSEAGEDWEVLTVRWRRDNDD